MSQKPRLLRSDLTGRVYVVTRYREGEFIEAITKYDVTEDFDALAATPTVPVVREGLDEAWAAAEAAAGERDALTVGRIVTVDHGTVYWAGSGPDENDPATMLGGKETPAAALLELAARLNEDARHGK